MDAFLINCISWNIDMTGFDHRENLKSWEFEIDPDHLIYA